MQVSRLDPLKSEAAWGQEGFRGKSGMTTREVETAGGMKKKFLTQR